MKKLTKKELNNLNEFDRLVYNLVTHKLTIRQLDIAYMEYIHRSEIIPDGVKNILAQREGSGLVRFLFDQISRTVANVELAYRRGGSK